jgi:hypothetical protein
MKLILHFRGAVSVTFLVAAASHVQAQLAVSGAAPAQPMNYQQVGPGVTLSQLSPVVYFRGILGMTPAERSRALAGKSADFQKGILSKVKEYQALPADLREIRLRQTQLRWDLLTLMKSAPEARPPLLKDVPPADRALLENRLHEWDLTPKAAQAAFLTNASFLESYQHWLSDSALEQTTILDKWPASRRQQWTNELARWQALPEDRRQQLSAQFRQLFDLDADRQKTTLNNFTEEERQQMETALDNFASLSPSQRKACVDSFEKFANMTAAERDQFLGNAARWEAMTPDDRKLWRAVVNTFPALPPMPPMPPGLQLPDPPAFPPFPPLPPVGVSAAR